MAPKKSMTIILRLSPAEGAALDRLAASLGITRSEAMRRALKEKLEAQAAKPVSVFERMKHLAGKYDSGRTDLSARSRIEYEQYIEAKHRARSGPR